MISKNYQHVLAFVFAIHEINADRELLPNITLGYKIYDNAFNPRRTYWTTLDLLFTRKRNPLNYNCIREGELMAVIGGLTPQNSIHMSHIFNTYKIPQLSYGSFDPVLKDKVRFPSFYQMVPNEDPQYAGIVQLFKHFGWNWIGLIISDDESGETFFQNLRPKLLQNQICIAWTMRIPTVTTLLPNKIIQEKLKPIRLILSLNKINVILVYGDRQSLEGLQIVLVFKEIFQKQPVETVWITTAQWDFTAASFGTEFITKTFNGTLSFALHTNLVPRFQDYLEKINPLKDSFFFLHEFWVTAFLCSFPLFNMTLLNKGNCTGKEKLANLPQTAFEMEMSGQSYSIYNAVYAIAHAIHAFCSSKAKQKATWGEINCKTIKMQPWQVTRQIPDPSMHPSIYPSNALFNHSLNKVLWAICNLLNVTTLKTPQSAGEEIFFGANGELESGYDLINLVTFPNGSFKRIRVGRMDSQVPAGKHFVIDENAVVWNHKFNETHPSSTCAESCHPGENRMIQQGKQICCYRCVPCPKHRISVNMDDILIGEFVSTAIAELSLNSFRGAVEHFTKGWILPKNYQLVLAFVFAIHEINKNDKLLPNLTLGLKIYENTFNPRRATATTLDLLFPGQRISPNYKCVEEKLVGIIGGFSSQNSIQMANILNAYKIPQLSYGSFDPVLSDKVQFPSFFQMVPDETSQYVGIIKLLYYFRWNWIALLLPEDESGERFLQTLSAVFIQKEICISWMQTIPIVKNYISSAFLQKKLGSIASSLLSNEINVILVYGDVQSVEGLRIILENYEFFQNHPMEKVWITTAQWDITVVFSDKPFTKKSFNGSLSFALHTNVVPGFQEYLENINPFQLNINHIHQFWHSTFLCSLPTYNLNIPGRDNCTGKEKLKYLPGSVFEMGMSGQSYSIYNAVYAVAHALHVLYALQTKRKAMGIENWNQLNVQPWQISSFLGSIRFNNSAGEEIILDGNRDLAAGYDIINLVTFHNHSFRKVQVGRMDPQAPAGKTFTINESAIIWNHKFKQVRTFK
ncbi:hypothetical protein JD844_001248 [Phrynosoma platyrhinos]|uniref:Vomeronasal type-2 receptor 26-like n=1 Tax=Phrynosoma platyrhinos TaxID=52577 RepID=A0ABQ7T9B0_PHRPL|nr:hypothetical protein JD844_001248 [Phrynosoma platyrhinos]